jgi:hypothetical protein
MDPVQEDLREGKSAALYPTIHFFYTLCEPHLTMIIIIIIIFFLLSWAMTATVRTVRTGYCERSAAEKLCLAVPPSLPLPR